MMQKILIDTSNLSTIAVCLEQLVNAERAQLSIEHQLDQSTTTLNLVHGGKVRKRPCAR
jgi:hypothetical protein